MPSPIEIAQTLRQELPPLQSAFTRTLRLPVTDQRELTAIPGELWTRWTVSVFGDGEHSQVVKATNVSIHALSDRAKALWGSEVQFNDTPYINPLDGELAKRTQELSAKKDPGSLSRLETLTSACARFLMISGKLIGVDKPEWQERVPSIPQTRIDAERVKGGTPRIRFRGIEFQYPLHTNPESVVSFGPGLSGNSFVSDMVGRAKNVHLVSGGSSAMFLRKWTQEQLASMARGIEGLRQSGELAAHLPDVPVNEIRLPETFYYDDGIAASIGILASRTVERGKPIDIAVMSAVHSAGRQEVEAGVDGAHHLLREGGLLVVKAPRTSLGAEGGMDVVVGRAIPLFGAPIAAGEAGTLRQAVDPSLPLDRPADFTIFQKQ